MKRRWCMIMLAALLAASPVTAYASEASGGEEWQVTFNGKKLESNFDNKDVVDQAKGLLPGDEVTLELSLKNASGRPADFYLSNEILKSFEEPAQADAGGTAGRAASPRAASASGGAYTYILTYEDASSSQELYNSSRIGGEGKDGSEVGLKEVEESLKDYLYLGRLNSGKGGALKLTIVLDGETQGNNYAQTLAQLKLNFAVEEVPEETTPGGGSGGRTVRRTVTQYVLTGVQTGDESRTLLWTVIALGSGLALLFLCVGRIRKDRGGDGNEE